MLNTPRPSKPYGVLQQGPKLYRGEPLSVAEQVLRDALAHLRLELASELAVAKSDQLHVVQAKAQIITDLETNIRKIIVDSQQQTT